jgi:putative spermidine/putrescine transport system substrate-binding protein/spermidine/putrescine transport system substrate-binding protein
MYAKIKAGGGSSYDLVTASGDLTRKLFDAGMLDAVDVAKVPNYEKLFPLFKNAPYNTFDGKNYGVSIAWGPDLLIYDPEQVTDEEASTWMTFFDPKFKGRISINDYSIFLADIKLWFYGPKDIFNIDAKELETKIKPKLMPLRPQIRKFWTSQGELTQLFEGKEIAMAWGWPVTVVQLQKDGFNVKATVPKEGTTGWSDSWMIIKGSPNKDIAQQWMNYMLEGEAQKKLVAASGYWPVSSAIVPLLSDTEKAQFHINDLDTYFKTIHFWETVPNLDQWNALWNEFKAQ